MLHASPLAGETSRYASVAYLLYLAAATRRDRSTLGADPDLAVSDDPSVRQIMVRGVVINLLNPKLTLFFFAFLPQFVTQGPGGCGSGSPHASRRWGSRSR